MIGHRARRIEHGPPQRLQMNGQAVSRHCVRERIVTARYHSLSDIDSDPARIEKTTLPVGHEGTAFAKEFHPVGQGLRKLHRAAVVPESRVRAFRRVVMEDEEIAYA